MNSRKQELKKELRKAITPDTMFICIGTMNSILDSLGPRVGEKLYKAGIPVCGTPKDPYHSLTYEKQNIRLNKYYKHANKIAIDACLCTEFYKLYKTKLSSGSITPGAGLGKKAPSVGNYAIRAYMLLKTESYLLTDSNLNLSGKYKEKVAQLNELVVLISDAIIEVYRELQEWPQIEKLDHNKIEEKYV